MEYKNYYDFPFVCAGLNPVSQSIKMHLDSYNKTNPRAIYCCDILGYEVWADWSYVRIYRKGVHEWANEWSFIKFHKHRDNGFPVEDCLDLEALGDELVTFINNIS